jgi:hypothetical protein
LFKVRCIQVLLLSPYHHYLELHTTGTTWGLHHRPVPYRVGVFYPPCAVRDVNTLLNFNCKYNWILAVQFGHARSINTQTRVNSKREEEELNFQISLF